MDYVIRKAIAGLLSPQRRRGCTKNTFRCDFWNWGEVTVRPRCCTNHLIELVFVTGALLERHGITYWLDYGTLLGAVRAGELIPWDSDVDFGILETDVARVKALEPEIRDAGLFLDATLPGVLRIVYGPVNHQYLDLFCWSPVGDQMTTPLASDYAWPGMKERAAFPAHYLTELTTASFYGRSFPAPSPIHEFLSEHRYGPDYMTPRKLTLEFTPDGDVDDMTPAVHAALAHASDRGRVLSQLRARSRLHQFDQWRAFIDDGLADEPNPHFLANARASLGATERSVTMDQVVRTVALTEQHIHELSDRRPSARADRVRKRVCRRAARIRAGRAGQQD